MLRPTYPIRTPRLALRPFTRDDLDAVEAYVSDPDVVRFLYWEVATDRAAARRMLDGKIGHWSLNEPGQSLILAIESGGTLIGEVVLKWLSGEHRQGEVGFVVTPAHQGHGYAAEAARAMLALAFDDLGLHRVIGRCDARNKASASVLERLGMRREAHFVQNEIFKGEWGDEYVYAILADEFARSGRA
ncbi:GNAT family protein [Virgisporangium ochraceum]|uniref:N-acetyltransferase n=1 Tax=Virgisporangium ochraceum TaxID=65505 RepID=A0A8J3ZUB3_9ACTN|nr:GNAT family N-acetyltransferase [Virgisporangium ochraceum]GIJ68580.1 N-acetyltransferase [Virgisporangium ochraceum]